MAGASVLAFWLVALVLIAVPGADWAFTLSAGLGGHSVLPAVGGLVAGYAAVTAIVAAGVGGLVAGSPAALTALTLVGGVYLVWHGAVTLLRPPAPGPAPAATGRTGWAVFAQGIGVSGLNPKGLLIFLALLPQFTDPGSGWPEAGQIGLLGLTYMATCAAFYGLLGTVARTVLAARPGAARVVSRWASVAMLLIGVVLVVDRLGFGR